MSSMIQIKTYSAPPINVQEILRYAGCRKADASVMALLEECLAEARCTYRVCWRELPVSVEENRCDFGLLAIESKDLAKNLAGCRKVLLFAATIGVEMDRLIGKYSRIAPAKGLILQAIGAERIEALCNAFCKEMGAMRPRFSPGYGDLPLEMQATLFQLLDCERKIGLCLNDSLLMSPSKSVTAFAGVGGEAGGKCTQCENINCEFRRME